MNLESSKERKLSKERKSSKERKEKKGTLMKKHFILLLLLLFSYFSNRSRPSGDQTSTFSGPGHFLIATNDRVTTKF